MRYIWRLGKDYNVSVTGNEYNSYSSVNHAFIDDTNMRAFRESVCGITFDKIAVARTNTKHCKRCEKILKKDALYKGLR